MPGRKNVQCFGGDKTNTNLDFTFRNETRRTRSDDAMCARFTVAITICLNVVENITFNAYFVTIKNTKIRSRVSTLAAENGILAAAVKIRC